MNKAQLLAFITKLTTSMKRIFPLKTEVTQDIATAKQEAMAYADTKVGEGLGNLPVVIIKEDDPLDLNDQRYLETGVYFPENENITFTNSAPHRSKFERMDVFKKDYGCDQIIYYNSRDFYKRSFVDEDWDSWKRYIVPEDGEILSRIEALKDGVPASYDTLNKLNTKINTKIADLKNDITSLGSFVGTASTYADLPDEDYQGENIANGDVAYLDTDDGEHKRGYYRFDGNSYQFMSGDLQHDDILGLMKATTLDDTVDNMFVTPKWVKDYNDANEPTQEEVDGAVDNG